MRGFEAGFRGKRGQGAAASIIRERARRFALKSAGSFDPALRGPWLAASHPPRRTR
ncbi:hypothetical protein CBM2586_B10403 [Cupriavidus phytorum]|uniref:Uncharacterized protein n=1 Tax=Cupriavidus taiwanensis TaxID=164546 RepID=A0A375C9I7_9BURK|nr:hypothetical protein CBM2586_B10403 [Cupriavidus taiwanensis]